MPYSKQPRTGKWYDRRIKIQKSEHPKIKRLHKNGLAIRAIARLYGVDKRLIQFILFPERKKLNYQHRLARGGHRQYYSTEKQRLTMRLHRAWLKLLRKQGKI